MVYLGVGLLLARGRCSRLVLAIPPERLGFKAAYTLLFSSNKTLPVLVTVFLEGVLFFGAFTYVSAYLHGYGIGFGTAPTMEVKSLNPHGQRAQQESCDEVKEGTACLDNHNSSRPCCRSAEKKMNCK